MPRTTFSAPDAFAVGRTLRTTRERVGLSQSALADRLDVSAAYVHKLETGKANPTVGTLARLAQALGATLDIRLAVDTEDDLGAQAGEVGV